MMRDSLGLDWDHCENQARMLANQSSVTESLGHGVEVRLTYTYSDRVEPLLLEIGNRSFPFDEQQELFDWLFEIACLREGK